MINKSKVKEVSLYGSLLAFISFVVYILSINQEVLYAAHNHSEFLYGSTFFDALMSKPFGLIQYAGAWLTQFLYNPFVGSCLFVGIWALIYIVGRKAFWLKGAATAVMLLPVACLLTSIVDLGYWIYVLPVRGYWFSQSLGYLLVLILLWVARYTPRKWHFVWYLIGFFLYPVLGWFALLFVLCLALSEKPTWREVLSIVVFVFSALIWHSLLYSNTKLEIVVSAGLPRFITAIDKTDSLTYPFYILGAISLVIPVFGRLMNKWYVPVLTTIAGIAIILSYMYKDDNYTAEMRMSRFAEDGNWKEVLAIAEQSEHPTSSMLMFRNVALMNVGGLLERSFSMGFESEAIHNPDSVHVSFLEIAAPVIYYNYGMLNEGFRLNFECAVQSGFSPIYLKMLARCAHANGEDNLANRYITQLQNNPCYKDWQPAEPSKIVRELHGVYPDEITGVEKSDSYIVNNISQWYPSDSKLASEQALFYSMFRNDSRRFWASFRKYIKLHMNEDFPVNVQEAYILFMDNAPEEKRVMLPISEEIYNRYKKFGSAVELLLKSGTNPQELPDRLRGEYGDTYWYYNIFIRRVY